jgi:hypothetical protein
MKVHFDDELEPYYTILLPNGIEKQTDDAHLAEREGDGTLAVNAKKSAMTGESHTKREYKEKTAQSRFQSGQEALYTDPKKNISAVTIIKVHFDDDLEPYYDILLPNGTEKQTDDAHLAELEEEGSLAVDAKKGVMNEPNLNPSIILPDPCTLAANGTPFDNGEIAEVSCESTASISNPFDAFDSLPCSSSALPLIENTTTQKGVPLPQSHFVTDAFASLKKTFSSNDIARQDEEKKRLLSLCIQCQVKDRRTLLMPCRHLCLCPACAASIADSRCPLCKEKVETTIEVLLGFAQTLL